MALFDKSLESGITFEQPVSSPSAVETGLKAASAGVSLFAQNERRGNSGSTYAREKDAFELSNFQDFQIAIDQAHELRGQGKSSAAQRLERNAAKNFARNGGDLGDGEVTSYYQSVTGRPSEWLAQDPQEFALNEIRTSEGYRMKFLSTFADGVQKTDAQRDNQAMAQLATEEAYESILTNAGNKFTVQTQSAMLGQIEAFGEENIGALSAMADAYVCFADDPSNAFTAGAGYLVVEYITV